MAIWHPDLPQRFEQDSFQLTYGKNTVRSEMSHGPPKSRRKCTSAPQIINGSMTLTTSQFVIFNTWYKTTLFDGNEPFDWLHPITEGIEVFKYLTEPMITSAGGTNWNLDQELEILV
jgi:hypothetical protein